MIKWTIETRKLSELKAYDLNPRRITEKGLNDLIQSLKLFGLAEPIVINRDDTIIGGHARVQAIKRMKAKSAAVYVPDRLLDEKEVQELCIRLNKNVAGQFDFDMLANQFDPRDLVSWGFEMDELGLGDKPEDDSAGSEGGDGAKRLGQVQIIHCPKCDHEFSVVEKKKSV